MKAMLLTLARLLTPAGALVCAAMTATLAAARTAEAGADFSAAQKIEVSLSSFAFTPATITLRAGQPYALQLVSRASGGHNFKAPAFFAAAQVSPGDAGKVTGGKVELRGGESTTIHLIPAAGSYKLVCSHFGHGMLGMKGTIIVR
jgi:plastocyanin